MLLSIAYIMIFGLLAGWACKKIKLPSLLGMLITGIILGPHALNLIDTSILSISTELRKIALIIILIRAGLNLDLNDLKKVGRPALLMCFVPACFEITGMIILAPGILGISTLDAAIMGAVIAAVSPAVIVPKMLKLMEEGYGTRESIPQLILAGASVDDVFVIVLFTAFMGLAKGETVSAVRFLNIPISIILGLLLGLGLGGLLSYYFSRIHIRDTVKIIILLSLAFILVSLEDRFGNLIPFSSLISVMGVGIALQKKREAVSKRLSLRFNKLWVVGEVVLFVLVGASVDISYAFSFGAKTVILLFAVLVFRMLGVLLSLIGTYFNKMEKAFCVLAYTPKATVQAAIGGLPLAAGLASGNLILSVSVLAIMITAPLGSFAIDLTYRKFLRNSACKPDSVENDKHS
jgi:NhaP-type Na+/H+ and K+/H+ antiporters